MADMISTTVTHLEFLRARDRYDIRALREEPRKRHLARTRAVVLRADGREAVYDLEDVGEILPAISVIAQRQSSVNCPTEASRTEG